MAPICGSGKRGILVKMIFCLLFLIPMTLSAGKRSISRQTQAVQNQLKRLNKPALQSIKSPDGDIIDCVHIKHQPAFDHPLLKNHTIQTAPSFNSKGHSFHETKASSNVKPLTQLWHLNGRCPEGTIPIRRTKEEDILRASSIESYGRKEHPSVSQPSSVNLNASPQGDRMRAIAYVQGEKYFGASGDINVWKPQVEQDGEFSSSQIWIRNGSATIEVGWQVNPHLYGDSQPRLFIYSSNDKLGNGCYNLLCQSFIQTHREVSLGAAIWPISANGGSQYVLHLDVYKENNGDWWLIYGNQYKLGYWPHQLLAEMGDSASRVEWGGEIAISTSNRDRSATQMGSGRFPREGFQKASFFKSLFVVDFTGNLTGPKNLQTFTSQSNCYDIQKRQRSLEWGDNFYYGGPGCV